MNTMIHAKIDAKLKKDAQKLADSFGLPLSTVISRKLREFVEEREIRFLEREEFKPEVAKDILEASKKIHAGDYSDFSKTFNSAEELIADLKN